MDNSLVIFGAGANGVKTLQALKEFEAVPDFFCDNDSKKWGTSIEDIQVISADELEKLTLDHKVRVIVSVSASHELEIREQLKDFSLEYHHIPQWIFMNSFYKQDIVNENIILIEKLKDLLQDCFSKEVLTAILEARKTENDDCLKGFISDRMEQYIPADIIKLQNINVVLDGGAFDGDTAVLFSQKTSAKKIYSFEPDPDNYEKLKRNIENRDDMKRVIPINKGLGHKDEIIHFSGGYNIGSHFSEAGALSCEITKIDTFFQSGEKVDFIKMDIEGFEKEALEGAKETIKRDRPGLAICLYHKPADLWEIPLMIHELVPEYKLYIRHYSKGLTETVLYAII